MPVVAADDAAAARLHELDLSIDVLTRTLLRADAEAKLTSPLEPPTAEGTTRYNKTVRYLREELVPAGWRCDDTRNFCRTIHPSGEFAVVTCSGDAFTGIDLSGAAPTTKYAKGEVTTAAVQKNVQPALYLGPQFEVTAVDDVVFEATWVLLQHVTDDSIFAEVSLPTRIHKGVIVDWRERILLPRIARQAVVATVLIDEPVETAAYTVNVALR